MGYAKGQEVLPAKLLEEIHKHFEGGVIYIPKKGRREGWGTLTGTKKDLEERNEKIRNSYRKGMSIDDLCDMYCLGIDSIRKIVYGKKVKN